MHVEDSPDGPVVFFDDGQDFRAWLEQHHEQSTVLWMGLNNKAVEPRGLTWDEAVPVALCYGWIDSTSRRHSEHARRQRWSPRKKGSTWSKVNVAHVERLVAAGLMRPAGLAAYENRREDRTGTYSFEQNDDLTLPEPYLADLQGNSAASSFWDSATAGYRKAATHWVLSAKQEATRERRMAELIADSAEGRLVRPQRYGEEPAWVRRWRESH